MKSTLCNYRLNLNKQPTRRESCPNLNLKTNRTRPEISQKNRVKFRALPTAVRTTKKTLTGVAESPSSRAFQIIAAMILTHDAVRYSGQLYLLMLINEPLCSKVLYQLLCRSDILGRNIHYEMEPQKYLDCNLAILCGILAAGRPRFHLTWMQNTMRWQELSPALLSPSGLLICYNRR